MKIDGKVVPFTATHYNFESGEFIRVTSGIYAEFLCGKYWTSCSVTKNSDLPTKLSGVGGKYMRLFKTGMARDFCNIRLFFIGSSYRI
ncbi:MAG: hypothetical protein RR856_12315 [Acinetobacter sp.]